ncbi:MAG: tetratricopeptide repeat protein [Candidatus Ancaeobacter aquaticus]|nr:tetratricopeptide repeat protein [Candidatus Ancaeobacter aquaticus]
MEFSRKQMFLFCCPVVCGLLSTFFCLFCIVATSYSEEVSGNYGAESALDVNIEEESSVTETGKMSRVKIGEELALKGKYEEAMHEFERSIREDPYNANAYLQLGLIYFYVKNDPKKAVELIKQALEIDHTLVDAYYNLGYIYAKAGQHDDAIDLYRKTIEIAPNYAEAHYSLGIVYYYFKDMVPEAEHEFKEALRLRPNYEQAHFFLGNIYGGQGKYDEAIKEFKIALEINPKYAEVHFFLGNILGGQGKFEEAIDEFQMALMSNPNDAEIHYKLGVIYDKMGVQDEAIKEFRTVLTLSPKHVEANNNLGFIYAKQGNYDEAIFEFKRALEVNPKYVKVMNNLGIVFAEKGEYEKALDSFNNALAIKENDPEAIYNIGMTYWKKIRDYDEAKKYFQQYIQLRPNDETTYEVKKILGKIDQDKLIHKQRTQEIMVEALSTPDDDTSEHYTRAVQLYTEGNIDKALSEFKIAAEKQENETNARIYMGVILNQKGRVDDAIEQLEKSIELTPDNPDAYYNLALIYDKVKNNSAKALTNYKKAIKYNKDYLDSYSRMGDIYARTGKIDKAMKQYEKTIELDTNYAKGYSNIGILFNSKGEYRKALDNIQKAIKIDPNDPIFYNNLANVYLENNNYTKARETIARAVELDPDSAISHCTYGEILESLKEYDLAIYHFEQATKDMKWRPYARRRIRAIKSKKKFNE